MIRWGRDRSATNPRTTLVFPRRPLDQCIQIFLTCEFQANSQVGFGRNWGKSPTPWRGRSSAFRNWVTDPMHEVLDKFWEKKTLFPTEFSPIEELISLSFFNFSISNSCCSCSFCSSRVTFPSSCVTFDSNSSSRVIFDSSSSNRASFVALSLTVTLDTFNVFWKNRNKKHFFKFYNYKFLC